MTSAGRIMSYSIQADLVSQADITSSRITSGSSKSSKNRIPIGYSCKILESNGKHQNIQYISTWDPLGIQVFKFQNMKNLPNHLPSSIPISPQLMGQIFHLQIRMEIGICQLLVMGNS